MLTKCREEIQELYKNGKSIAWIADCCNCDRSTIYYHLGMKPNKPRIKCERLPGEKSSDRYKFQPENPPAKTYKDYLSERGLKMTVKKTMNFGSIDVCVPIDKKDQLSFIKSKINTKR